MTSKEPDVYSVIICQCYQYLYTCRHVSGPQIFTYNLHDVQLLHVFRASELFVLFTSLLWCWLTWAESAAEPLILYCSSSF